MVGTGELGLSDGTLGPGQTQDGDGCGSNSAALGKAGVRYPKTKKVNFYYSNLYSKWGVTLLDHCIMWQSL